MIQTLKHAGENGKFDPQHLMLGYAIITAARLLEEADCEQVADPSTEPIGVAVGWDSGHPIYLGFIERSGFARRSAADGIAGAVKYKARFDAAFDARFGPENRMKSAF
ncbi:MAG: hypothetical protein ACJARS_000673 [bacterium]